MTSSQSLSDTDRRTVASWAADCAEHVVHLFEEHSPGNPVPREAIDRVRAYARGELSAAEEIKRRFVAGRAASGVDDPAAAAAARAAAQAAAVAHMGAHALGAAAYAAKAAALAAPEDAHALDDEVGWQLDRMTDEVRRALARLPALGEDAAGPLGSGLLASGTLGEVIRAIQADLRRPRPAAR
ncbi:putative immunity protein [Leifsonia sp. NPDC080035]|uniref:Immunity protein n=1 Tax=Leifsonia sp. NPDC080035 TaxID=3143936 RepID=A0AAU7G976_9MICO